MLKQRLIPSLLNNLKLAFGAKSSNVMKFIAWPGISIDTTKFTLYQHGQLKKKENMLLFYKENRIIMVDCARLSLPYIICIKRLIPIAVHITKR